METNSENILRKGTTPHERQAIIMRWKESGKSKKEFCSENGINYYTLMSWLTPKKKHKAKQSKPIHAEESFSEVKLPSKFSSNIFARISFGKSSVDIFQPVSPDFLLRLLNA